MRVSDVADFVASLRWDAIPDEARARLRLALIDTIACIIGGVGVPAARAAARAARGQGSVMEACAMAVAASALDFDDGHYEAGGIHLGSVVVPALLSALPAKASGIDFLTAMASAYEVGIRAGYLMAPREPGDPYHTSGAAASIGAAAGVARLVGLDVEAIAAALRIASAQAPIARLQLPMVKESIGWGAASARGAALLAASGFAVESEMNPQSAFALGIAPTPFEGRGGDDAFVADLGERWRLLDVYVKPYPCCRAIHAAIDGVLAVLDEGGWSHRDIALLEVAVPMGMETLDFLPPASIEHAQFSIPWVLGCLIVRGSVSPTEFTAQALNDRAIVAAARRVRVRADPQLHPISLAHSYPACVAITVAGCKRTCLVEHAAGSVARPLPAAKVREKFLAAALPVLGAASAARSLAMLEGPVEALDPAIIRSILAQIMESTT